MIATFDLPIPGLIIVMVLSAAIVAGICALSKKAPWRRCTRCCWYFTDDGDFSSSAPEGQPLPEDGLCPHCVGKK